MLPVVSIVGKPNVGKSTIFNAITKQNRAIIYDYSGVTRDRIYETAKIDGQKFILVDTGGFVLDENEEIEKLVKKQALIAIEESELVLAILDIKTELNSTDIELIDFLRKSNKNFIVILNKADTPKDETLMADFFKLGSNIITLSATQKRGFDKLFNLIKSYLPENRETPEIADSIKIGILGRPNVGKSSLVNKLLGYERVIVSDVPGTTRDSVDTMLHYKNSNFTLIDTAGIRRKSRISFDLEKISVIRSITTIERSDVLVVMHDAMEGATHQDKSITNLINNRGKGAIIVFNKWDKFKGQGLDEKRYTALVKEHLQFINYAPVVKISAMTGENVNKILDLSKRIYRNQQTRVPTAALNKFLENISKKHSHPVIRGKQLKIKFMTQAEVNPPKFILFCNFPDDIKDSYKNYIENQLRSNFGFEGVPIKLFFKKK